MIEYSPNSGMQLLFLSYCYPPIYSELEIETENNLKVNALVSSGNLKNTY